MESLVSRLFKIVDLLQSTQRLTTKELARQLGVSERTVSRDVGRLQDLELPITVTPGRQGGVSLAPGALLPALRFTDDEALALGYGLLLARRSGSVALERASKSASDRLSSVLSSVSRQRLEALTGTLTELPLNKGDSKTVTSSVIFDLAEAVKTNQQVELSYRSRRGEITSRQLDPYGMVQFERFWYVAGYCHLRRDVRIFRLDRIRRVLVTEEHFRAPEAFDTLELVSKAIAETPSPGTVTCRIRLHCTLIEASRLAPAATVMLEPLDQGVLMSTHYPHETLEQLALYLLGFRLELEVLEPAELKNALVRVATRALKLASQA